MAALVTPTSTSRLPFEPQEIEMTSVSMSEMEVPPAKSEVILRTAELRLSSPEEYLFGRYDQLPVRPTDFRVARLQSCLTTWHLRMAWGVALCLGLDGGKYSTAQLPLGFLVPSSTKSKLEKSS